jgi:hypothetical protein
MKSIETLINEKMEEHRRLIEKNEAYIQVLKDILRSNQSERPQSTLSRAAEAIKEAGRPLHADEILVKLGKKKTTKNKANIVSSIAHYASAGKMFKRTDPNTFDVLN